MSCKVFISYSHDSDEHRARVLGLSERLRADGIETVLDQYVNGAPEQGWPRWMLDQLDAADWVILVSSETYYRRFRGREVPGKGKGVDWEGALITQEIYDSRSRTLRFVPVLFPGATPACIPEPLRSVTHYMLSSEEAYGSLYDFLLKQAGVEAGPVGSLKTKPRRKGSPITFGKTLPSTEFRAEISRIFKYAPEKLIGREEELKLLKDAWAKVKRETKKRPHVLTFVALGGEGKTSLVAKWAAELAAQDWPGCDAVFAWSFYSQGTREQMAASSDLFLKEALTFFGDDEDKAFAASPAGAYEKGQRLARIVGQRRSLLILDGLEPLQYAPTSPTPGQLKDQGIAALLKGLAANSHGLCVVTTRYSVPDLKAFWQTSVREEKLLRLSPEAGVHLLKTLGVMGTTKEFETLVEDVKGHALTLTLLGGFLKRAFHGDIRQRDRVKFEKADEKMDGGHAFRTMAAYEQWLLRDGGDEGQREMAVLRLMGLFDRPADAGCLAALRSETIPGLTEPLADVADDDWEYCLSGLEAAKLLTVNRDAFGVLVSLDAHPLLREYFARQLRGQKPDAWRAAHCRLYEHLCKHKEGDEPTLEDLQPLYQAVAHGCQAGLQQQVFDEVYHARIVRMDDHYSFGKLGSFGSDLEAIANFFDCTRESADLSSSKNTEAYLLHQAAHCLSALGRLTESLRSARSALKIRVARQEWLYALESATHVSQMELMMGDIASALQDAEQSMAYAEKSGDAFCQMARLAGYADVLHQAGRSDAQARFNEASQLWRKIRGRMYLPSMAGFWCCDLLLAGAEPGTWRIFLNKDGQHDETKTFVSTASSDVDLRWPLRHDDALTYYYNVAARAASSLGGANDPETRVITVALDHLILGRAKLYINIRKAVSLPGSSTQFDKKVRGEMKACAMAARGDLDAAVVACRRAGDRGYLVAGLVTRAWLRFLSGACTGSGSAQEDLDEAWEIAERGPMRLFMADIHLYRARLFFREKEYPEAWISAQADLDAAGHLIDKCGYHRRDEELKDAKRAILGVG
ncbi:MAG TPA: TIR and AAA domain-containing protein [Verrucomicrobiales bacterium]|nr:TIR and AAA domain-containing protein [Verrucomicrobiales bacterium]